jgi:hypothetical protein
MTQSSDPSASSCSRTPAPPGADGISEIPGTGEERAIRLRDQADDGSCADADRRKLLLLLDAERSLRRNIARPDEKVKELLARKYDLEGLGGRTVSVYNAEDVENYLPIIASAARTRGLEEGSRSFGMLHDTGDIAYCDTCRDHGRPNDILPHLQPGEHMRSCGHFACHHHDSDHGEAFAARNRPLRGYRAPRPDDPVAGSASGQVPEKRDTLGCDTLPDTQLAATQSTP